ncbi:MAG: 1-acyl-sn-glycerol-3-phosphate acyltransferase [Prolixibacteraceae bacterium]
MKYEKWSFGYWCLKQYITFATWLIHKKTIVTGREKIPKNKPVIFAPNHQNALSDPMAILLNTSYQLVWLARADIFNSKILVNILRYMKIMPVYRLRDGKANLNKNDQTFTDAVKVLEHNKALALFPEAGHSGKRQMLPHKKAVPRIVFMAGEKAGFSLDVQIIPAGINYSHYWNFNRTVIVNFGDPIPVKDYFESYRKNPGAAIIELKNKIYQSILPLLINIRSKIHYHDFERIRNIYSSHFLQKLNLPADTLNQFRAEQKLVNRLDQLEAEQPEQIKKITQNVNAYVFRLKKLKIKNRLVDEQQNRPGKLLRNILMLIAGLPLFIYGLIFNAVPFYTLDRVVRKKVKDKTFWSTFFLVGGIILFPLVYLAELLVLSSWIPGIWLKLAFVVSLPFAGKLAYKWYILWLKTAGRFRIYRIKQRHGDQYKSLLNEKQEIFNQLDELLLF